MRATKPAEGRQNRVLQEWTSLPAGSNSFTPFCTFHYTIPGARAIHRYRARRFKRVWVWRYRLARGIIPGVDQDQTIYEPKDAAQWLGLSTAGLRRLAGIYERVYGDLPRDARRGRLWPQDALYRLERARMLVQEGSAPSVEAALRFEETGDDAGLYPLPRKAGDANLAALLEELRAINTRLAAIENENRQLREAIEHQNQPEIEAPTDPPEPQNEPESAEPRSSRGTPPQEPETGTQHPWWRRIFSNT